MQSGRAQLTICRGLVSRRRLLGTTALGSSATALLASCGVGKKNGSASSQSSSSQNATPKPGGTLNVPLRADFFDFDNSTDGKDNYATQLAYDTLLQFREGPGVPYDQLTTAPSLAERWEVSSDATTYTFHLRPGLKFATVPPVNGRALTSDDVKWSYEYYARSDQFKNSKLKPSLFSYMLQGMDRVDTPDPQTAVVHFSAPFGPFLNYASTPVLPIVPHEIYDADGNFSNRMAGSGPFQLNTVASQRGAQWLFTKNPSYWDSGKPYVDQIREFVLTDEATLYAAFQTKQIDILQDVSDPSVLPTLKTNNPDAVIQQSINPNTAIIWLSVQHPPFSDLRLRQAFNLAIDRDELSQTLAGAKGDWAMPASLPGMWTTQEIKQILKFNPAQAKQLVSAAGYPNGLDVDLMASTSSNSTQVKTAQLVQAQLKKANINITIKPTEATTYSTSLHSGTFTASVAQALIFADLDSRFFGAFHSGSGSNYIGLKDPKLDQMIEAQRREPDPTKRQQLIKDTSRYLAENAYETTLYQQVLYTLWHPYVKGYGDNWMRNNWNAPNVWLAR